MSVQYWRYAVLLVLVTMLTIVGTDGLAAWSHYEVEPIQTQGKRGKVRIRIRREETTAEHKIYVRKCSHNYDICEGSWGNSQMPNGFFEGWTFLQVLGASGPRDLEYNPEPNFYVNRSRLIDLGIWSSHFDFDRGLIGYARHAVNNHYTENKQVFGPIVFNGRTYCGNPYFCNPTQPCANWRDISDLVYPWVSPHLVAIACVEDWRRDRDWQRTDDDRNDLSIVADLRPNAVLHHHHRGYAGVNSWEANLCWAWGYAIDEAYRDANGNVNPLPVDIYINGIKRTTTWATSYYTADPGACHARGGFCGWGVDLRPFLSPHVEVEVKATTYDYILGEEITLFDSPKRMTCVTANPPTPTWTPTPTRTPTPTATPTPVPTLILERDYPFLLQCGARVGQPTQVLRATLTANVMSGQTIRLVLTGPTGQTTLYGTTDPQGRVVFDATLAGGDPCFGSTQPGDWSARAFYDPIGLASNSVGWRVSWYTIHTTK